MAGKGGSKSFGGSCRCVGSLVRLPVGRPHTGDGSPTLTVHPQVTVSGAGATKVSHPGCIMVGSLKHRRFGLFGTERTGAGIIKIRAIRPTLSDCGVRGTSEVEAGAGPTAGDPSGDFRVLGGRGNVQRVGPRVSCRIPDQDLPIYWRRCILVVADQKMTLRSA